MDSHESSEYRAGRYCARIAQVSSIKNEILRFSSSGKFWHPMDRIWKDAIWVGILKKVFSALWTGFENSPIGLTPDRSRGQGLIKYAVVHG